MALFIRQDDERSELQRRVAAELREKAKRQSQLDEKRPDGVEDSRYLQDTKQTTSLAWVWILIVLFAIAGMIYIVVTTSH
jgi:hypothetical protein